jgi:hypothetical protein
MPSAYQGPIEAVVYAETEFPYLKDSPGGRYGLALVISFGLHLLILWLAADYLLDSKTFSTSPQPRAIRLSLSPAKTMQSDPTTHQDSHSLPRMDGDEISKEDTIDDRSPERDGASTQTARPNTASDQAVTNKSRLPAEPHEQASIARIMASAKSITRKLAAEDTSETKPRDSVIASVIEKALNRQTEPPGVSTLADGTIRVVTQFGTTYCIKPRDDTGILGPEDDMSVSMTCN